MPKAAIELWGKIYQFSVDEQTLRVLDEKGEISRNGLKIVYLGEESPRKSAIAEEARKMSRERFFRRASIDERLVVRAWNRDPYIQGNHNSDTREARNNAVPFGELKNVMPTVAKALKSIGKDEILRSMKIYFEFCGKGGHIWHKVNHGFRHVEGFLKKLIALHKDRQRGWWDIQDDPGRILKSALMSNPLARRVAHSFAYNFLNMDMFIFDSETRPKDIENFIDCAARIKSFVKWCKRRGDGDVTDRDVLQGLLECLDELFVQREEKVYTSYLSSPAIWKTALVQHLRDNGVLN